MATGSGAVKGTVWRGYLRHLDRVGASAEVKARIDADTRRLFDAVPLPSDWIDARHATNLIEAYALVTDASGLRRLAREGATASLLPVVESAARSIVRIFGASPAAILGRFGTILGSSFRGIDFEWKPSSPKGGTLTVVHLGRHDGANVFETWAGGVEYVLAVCNVRGTVAVTSVAPAGPDTVARIAASWA